MHVYLRCVLLYREHTDRYLVICFSVLEVLGFVVFFLCEKMSVDQLSRQRRHKCFKFCRCPPNKQLFCIQIIILTLFAYCSHFDFEYGQRNALGPVVYGLVKYRSDEAETYLTHAHKKHYKLLRQPKFGLF